MASTLQSNEMQKSEIWQSKIQYYTYCNTMTSLDKQIDGKMSEIDSPSEAEENIGIHLTDH